MIQVAIVEDQPSAAQVLGRCLLRYQTERKLELKITAFFSGVAFLSDTTTMYDIVFMDIEMPHMDGMQVSAEMRKRNTETCLIFVTNMAQYAIRGYEVAAMDFLLKPVTYQTVAFRLDRAIAIIRKRKKTELTIKQKNGLVRLQISDIYYVESIQHQIVYHTGNGEIETWGSLNQVEQILPGSDFARCNASYLVNLCHVDRVRDNFVYVGGVELSLTRGKKQSFMKALMAYLEESV